MKITIITGVCNKAVAMEMGIINLKFNLIFLRYQIPNIIKILKKMEA